MHSDRRISSSCKVETDIIELYLVETSQHMLRHVLKCVLDMCWATWHKISKFSHVEYELQRTTQSTQATRRIPLDSHFASRCRIQNDRFDQAFRRIFERHDDLPCLHRFPWHAFFFLPGCVRQVVIWVVTSIDNTTRCDSWLDAGSLRKFMEMPPSSIAVID